MSDVVSGEIRRPLVVVDAGARNGFQLIPQLHRHLRLFAFGPDQLPYNALLIQYRASPQYGDIRKNTDGYYHSETIALQGTKLGYYCYNETFFKIRNWNTPKIESIDVQLDCEAAVKNGSSSCVVGDHPEYIIGRANCVHEIAA